MRNPFRRLRGTATEAIPGAIPQRTIAQHKATTARRNVLRLLAEHAGDPSLSNHQYVKVLRSITATAGDRKERDTFLREAALQRRRGKVRS